MTHHEVDGAADFLGLHLVSFHAVPAGGEKFQFFSPVGPAHELKRRCVRDRDYA